MQTLYFTTRNFIRHEGNVVDLAEYRTRLQACSGFDAVPAWEEDFFPDPGEGEAPQPVLRAVERRPRSERRDFLSLLRLPDLCATLAVVVMAVVVVARFLCL